MKLKYRTRAIITRGLYLFYPIFHCGLYCRAVYIAARLVYSGIFFFISTLFYFGVVYFTIEFERKKKKQGCNYGQIFPKIVHQKITIVFYMQHSFCLTLNAIQTNIKESKAFKRINLRLR